MQPPIVQFCYKRKLFIPLLRYSLFRVLQIPVAWPRKVEFTRAVTWTTYA